MPRGILFEYVNTASIQLNPNGVDGHFRVPVYNGSALLNVTGNAIITLDLNDSGVNGLDSGSLTGSTGYDVRIISKSDGTDPA